MSSLSDITPSRAQSLNILIRCSLLPSCNLAGFVHFVDALSNPSQSYEPNNNDGHDDHKGRRVHGGGDNGSNSELLVDGFNGLRVDSQMRLLCLGKSTGRR